jgi:hypothetical protein
MDGIPRTVAEPQFHIRFFNRLLAPGDRRRFGFVFVSGDEAANVLREEGAFYLWEGGFIGEARRRFRFGFIIA